MQKQKLSVFFISLLILSLFIAVSCVQKGKKPSVNDAQEVSVIHKPALKSLVFEIFDQKLSKWVYKKIDPDGIEETFIFYKDDQDNIRIFEMEFSSYATDFREWYAYDKNGDLIVYLENRAIADPDPQGPWLTAKDRGRAVSHISLEKGKIIKKEMINYTSKDSEADFKFTINTVALENTYQSYLKAVKKVADVSFRMPKLDDITRVFSMYVPVYEFDKPKTVKNRTGQLHSLDKVLVFMAAENAGEVSFSKAAAKDQDYNIGHSVLHDDNAGFLGFEGTISGKYLLFPVEVKE